MTRNRHALFVRSRNDRLLLGVAGGIAEALGIDAVLVRLAFGALTVANGVGIAFYVVAWALSTEGLGETATVPPARPASGWTPTIAIGCIVLGALLVLRDAGIWFGDTLVWPLLVAGFGSAVIWFRSDAGGRARWTAAGERLVGNPSAVLTAATWARVGAGAVLVLSGMTFFLFAHQSAGAAGTALVAIAATAGGLGLILAPWIVGLAREATAERRERIRSEERAEIAAHLHDSVLHTLALIQRGDVPPELASVARRQERDLRAWLNGRSVPGESTDLRGALDAVASRVEEMHHVPVETVVVGDAPLNDAANAVVQACQEAAINAARHSGTGRVSIYVEVDAHEITAFVRDQGGGFDPDAVPGDRRGISGSIVGRMRRLGGTATVVSRPGEGTEVQIHIARSGS